MVASTTPHKEPTPPTSTPASEGYKEPPASEHVVTVGEEQLQRSHENEAKAHSEANPPKPDPAKK